MQLSRPDCERAVLAGIYNFGINAYIDVSSLVSVDSFHIDINQILYKIFEYLFQKDPEIKLDLPTIYSTAKSLGFTKLDKTEQEHIRAITKFPIHRENIIKFAAIVAKLYIARNLFGKHDECKSRLLSLTGEEPLEEILNVSQNTILDYTGSIYSNNIEDFKLIGDGLNEHLKFLEDNPRTLCGVPTGFKRLDIAMGGGLRFGTSVVGAARMKQGKSLLANAMSLHISKNIQLPLLYIDTELDWQSQSSRLLASIASVPFWEIETGQFAQNEFKKGKVLSAKNIIKELPYTYASVRRKTFEDVISLIRRWIIRKVGLQENGKAKPCVVVYDWLKVMDIQSLSKNLNESQLLGFYITTLNDLFDKYGVAGLIFTQENRSGIKDTNSGTVFGSDRIAMFCSGLFILKEKEAGDENMDKYNMKLITQFSRFGNPVKFPDYINVNKIGKYCQMIEGPTNHEINLQCNNSPESEKGFVIDESQPESTQPDSGTACKSDG